MSQTRPIKQLVLGVFSIGLGVISLVAFSSVTYSGGVGFLGGFYRIFVIATGLS